MIHADSRQQDAVFTATPAVASTLGGRGHCTDDFATLGRLNFIDPHPEMDLGSVIEIHLEKWPEVPERPGQFAGLDADQDHVSRRLVGQGVFERRQADGSQPVDECHELRWGREVHIVRRSSRFDRQCDFFQVVHRL